MDRQSQAPTSSSVGATHPPRSTVTLRLRPRGDSETPPVPPAHLPPSAANTTILPREVSTGSQDNGSLVSVAGAENGHVLPQSPSCSFLPVASGTTDRDGTSISEEVHLHSMNSHVTPGSIGQEGLSLHPPLKTRVQEDGPSPFTHLPEDLILQVASMLRSSRQDVEYMRSVIKTWRKVIPSTIDPCLVFSRQDPDPSSEVLIFEMARTERIEEAHLKRKLLLSQPPTGVSCWGSALGLLAMQSQPLAAGETFVYCLHCGNSKSLLQIPARLIPRGLFLEPYTPMRFLLVSASYTGDSMLRIDTDDYPWRLEGGLLWLPSPGFADFPLITVALQPGVLRAGASRLSIVIVDESGRPLDNEAEMLHIPIPLLYLSDDTIASPWVQNGRHLFLCEGQLYFAEVFDHPTAQFGMSVRLFVLQKSELSGYSLAPTSTIGDYSVYLGPNQAIVLPACKSFVGRRSNTMYIEDFRGNERQQRLLAVNFSSLESFVVPFPQDIKALDKQLLPSVWVGLPSNNDVTNHCKGSTCWRFWD